MLLLIGWVSVFLLYRQVVIYAARLFFAWRSITSTGTLETTSFKTFLKQKFISQYQVLFNTMFLQIDVFLVDIVVEVEVERHIQKVDEYQFSDWSHRASRLHSLQHPHVDCRQE